VLCPIRGLEWTCRAIDLHGRTLLATDARPESLAPFNEERDVIEERKRTMLVLAMPQRSFRRANLKNAWMFGIDLSDADLQEATLESAYLYGANLLRADLRRAKLASANLGNADLRHAVMEGAILSGAHLEDSKLNDAKLQAANLRGANLREAILIGTHLQNADLTLAQLHAAHADKAHLSFALMDGSKIMGAFLTGADLGGASLRGADLRGADITDALFDGADITGASLALSAGSLRSCKGVIRSSASITDDSVEGFAKRMIDAQIGEDYVAALIQSRTNTIAHCDDQPFTAMRIPEPEIYENALRAVTCRDPAATRYYDKAVPMKTSVGNNGEIVFKSAAPIYPVANTTCQDL
jgi:uncharacterized protein YjbI with pentapeptide repeats